MLPPFKEFLDYKYIKKKQQVLYNSANHVKPILTIVSYTKFSNII